ncbi:MAG: efflux RND transporter periplasmic adaptor subunit, partial [Verrucomicrobiota bacterium]
MKKTVWIMGCLFLAFRALGQHGTNGSAKCDCPSCNAPAGAKQFTLPGLQGLEDEAVVEEHGEHDHKGNDHSAEGQAGKPAPHVEQTFQSAHPEHEDCDHDHAGHNHEKHEGHDHGAEAAGELELSAEMAGKLGIQIHEAEGGTIAKTAVFPAEIKLNRDRAAAVSPRYASIVRQVFAEIGDSVRKGDVLASLENRETMAVYTVAAPLDGVIISKDLAVGETAAEDKVLYEVADLSTVWADISIFPKYQHLLRKGMPVEFVAHDGHTAHGKVKYISPIISHETRTFTARCVLDGARDDFTPGAFVRARINIETVEAAVVVPREAVQTVEGETVVFVPGEHGFQTSVVELGLADGHNVEIKRGLHAGDHYVAAGA